MILFSFHLVEKLKTILWDKLFKLRSTKAKLMQSDDSVVASLMHKLFGSPAVDYSWEFLHYNFFLA